MPIYEYQCSHCQHQFDELQKLQDAPISQCPQCHQATAIRLVSAAGFQLKGSGWYATDFKNKGKPEAKTEQSRSASSEESSKATTAAEKTSPESTKTQTTNKVQPIEK